MMDFFRSRYFPATLFAIAVHLLLVGLMVLGVSWPERPRDFELRPIQLEFANLQEMAPIPVPDPPVSESPPQAQPQQSSVEDQQALALRRQEQEDNERLERERREQEQEARRQAELQAERARQLEEERRQNQRRAEEERARQREEQRQEQERIANQQRLEAERQQELERQEQQRRAQEQERQQQAQAAEQAQAERAQRLAEIVARGSGTDTGVVGGSETSTNEPGLAEMHQALIRRQIQQAWRLPPTARSGMRVVVNIRLLPTGELREASIVQSSGNAEFDRSALDAVNSVNHFNVPRDPVVFENVFRSLNLDFDPEGLRL